MTEVPVHGADSPEVWHDAVLARGRAKKADEMLARLMNVDPPNETTQEDEHDDFRD